MPHTFPDVTDIAGMERSGLYGLAGYIRDLRMTQGELETFLRNRYPNAHRSQIGVAIGRLRDSAEAAADVAAGRHVLGSTTAPVDPNIRAGNRYAYTVRGSIRYSYRGANGQEREGTAYTQDTEYAPDPLSRERIRELVTNRVRLQLEMYLTRQGRQVGLIEDSINIEIIAVRRTPNG